MFDYLWKVHLFYTVWYHWYAVSVVIEEVDSMRNPIQLQLENKNRHLTSAWYPKSSSFEKYLCAWKIQGQKGKNPIFYLFIHEAILSKNLRKKNSRSFSSDLNQNLVKIIILEFVPTFCETLNSIVRPSTSGNCWKLSKKCGSSWTPKKTEFVIKIVQNAIQFAAYFMS